MPDTFTTVSHQSYGSRLGGALKGICFGVVLFLCSIWLLVWNEGNTVAWHRALDEGLANTANLPSPETVDPTFEGKLVHVVGFAETETTLQDEVFGVAASEDTKFLKLKRNVEMYQWQETSRSSTKKNTGGSTTTTTEYSYSKTWSGTVISSSSFKQPEGHENPNSMPAPPGTAVADPITFGAFTLPSPITILMNWYVGYPGTLSVDDIPDEWLRDQAKPYGGNGFYLGSSPSSPAVGDARVTFQVVQPQTISIIAQQIGSSFSQYSTKSGNKSILLVEKGTESTEAMFEHAQAATVFQAWLFRFLGFLMMYIGLTVVVKPLEVAADVLPFLGNCVGGLTSCLLFPVALVLSLVIIALSWVAYRPFLAGSFLLAVGGLVYYRYKNRPRSEVPMAQAYVVGHVEDHVEDHDLELQANYV